MAVSFKLGLLLLSVGVCLGACNRLPSPTEPSSSAQASTSVALVPASLPSGAFIGRFDALPTGSALVGAPGDLVAQVTAPSVLLTWGPASGDPLTYVIEVGSGPGLSNLANFATGSLETMFTANGVPNGAYFVRVRAANAEGLGPPSNEVTVIVATGPCTPPGPASGLTGSVSGSAITISWVGVQIATSYQVEVGSAPGLADLFNGDVGRVTTLTASVARGTYHVRVRAKSACGTSDPSNEVRVTVGGSGPVTIAFDNVGSHGSSFGSYIESGFTVTPVTGAWTVSRTYGNPTPFVQFTRAAGENTITAEIRVTAGGVPFSFVSVDLYSSVTPIPYTLIGLMNSTPMFTFDATVPNTFGRFATVHNPSLWAGIIDTLVIRLTNPATSPCCSNPVGLDNIVVSF